MNTSITLLIPQKTDIEHEQVFSAWIKNGGQIKRLDRFWVKDEQLVGQRIAIYGNQAFAFVVAQIYGVEFSELKDINYLFKTEFLYNFERRFINHFQK